MEVKLIIYNYLNKNMGTDNTKVHTFEPKDPIIRTEIGKPDFSKSGLSYSQYPKEESQQRREKVRGEAPDEKVIPYEEAFIDLDTRNIPYQSGSCASFVTRVIM
jgi:hypothetical protein